VAKEKKIVDYINYYLLASMGDKRFAGKKAYGMTELHKRGDAVLPALQLETGELKYVGIDDVSPLIIYHRSNGTTETLDTITGFGSRNDNYVERSNMSMYVYAQADKMKMSSSELKDFLLVAMPDVVDRTSATNIGIRSGFIKHSTTNFNSLEIFKREYRIKREFDPSFYFLEIKYSIETRFKKTCVKTGHCTPISTIAGLLTESGEALLTESGENIIIEE